MIPAPPGFTLYLVTDRKQTGGRPLTEVVEQALAGGVRGVQLREKDLPARTLYELAREMRELTARFGAKLLINDRIDIALAVEADGVHLGEEGMPLPAARRLLGDRLIGVSCHSLDSARFARDNGADFITLGPLFPTPSKAAFGEPMGVERFRDIVSRLQIPAFALGGIKRDNLRQPMEAGAYGVSLISAIIAAADPRREAEMILSLLEKP